MERKEIVKAVRELNKVLGLEPKIDVKLPTEELIELLGKAVDLIEPEDVISEATEEVLEKLQENENGNDEEEEEEEPAVEEEIKIKEIRGKKKPSSKTETPKLPIQTRIAAATEVIKEIDKEISKEKWVELTNKRYQKGEKINIKESTWAVNVAIQCLETYGIIEQKNGKIIKNG